MPRNIALCPRRAAVARYGAGRSVTVQVPINGLGTWHTGLPRASNVQLQPDAPNEIQAPAPAGSTMLPESPANAFLCVMPL